MLADAPDAPHPVPVRERVSYKIEAPEVERDQGGKAPGAAIDSNRIAAAVAAERAERQMAVGSALRSPEPPGGGSRGGSPYKTLRV